MLLIQEMKYYPLTGNTEREITLTERKIKTAVIAPDFPVMVGIKKVIVKLVLQSHVPFVEVTILALALVAFLLLVPKINLAAMTASVAEAPPLVSFLAPSESPADSDPEGFVEEFRTATERGYAQGIYEDAEQAFYRELVRGNYRIVQAVFEYGVGINKDLIFAQMEKESSFFPRAINENIDKDTGEVTSIDRGLFQLNSKSYPDLSEAEFFNIEINIRYGIAHLREELEYHRGNTRRALWTYNAGRYGISDGVPTQTLAYATEILARTKQIAAARNTYIKEKLAEYSVYSPVTISAVLASATH
jgi:hypothetical protein